MISITYGFPGPQARLGREILRKRWSRTRVDDHGLNRAYLAENTQGICVYYSLTNSLENVRKSKLVEFRGLWALTARNITIFRFSSIAAPMELSLRRQRFVLQRQSGRRMRRANCRGALGPGQKKQANQLNFQARERPTRSGLAHFGLEPYDHSRGRQCSPCLHAQRRDRGNRPLAVFGQRYPHSVLPARLRVARRVLPAGDGNKVAIVRPVYQGAD